jgi:hypothetical protein
MPEALSREGAVLRYVSSLRVDRRARIFCVYSGRQLRRLQQAVDVYDCTFLLSFPVTGEKRKETRDEISPATAFSEASPPSSSRRRRLADTRRRRGLPVLTFHCTSV